MPAPVEGLARLRAAAESGELDALCARHGVRVLAVFGSAAAGDPNARDLDIAVLMTRDVELAYLAIIDDLTRLTGVAEIDLAHLDTAGPVLRERALVGSVVLFESEPGAWASASTAAALERMDTAWMRRLDLELLAQ